MGMYGASALTILKEINESSYKKTKPLTFEGKIIAFVVLVTIISIIGVYLVNLGEEAAIKKKQSEAARKAQKTEEQRSSKKTITVRLSENFEMNLPNNASLVSEKNSDSKLIKIYSFKDKFTAYDDFNDIDEVYKGDFDLKIETEKRNEDPEQVIYDRYSGKDGTIHNTDLRNEQLFIYEGSNKDGYCWKDSDGNLYLIELSGKHFHEYQDELLEMVK